MEWISVKDRMPEDGLTEKQSKSRVNIRCILTDGKKVFAGSRTRHGTDQRWFWNRYSKIIYWMPLPEPPKEEQP